MHTFHQSISFAISNLPNNQNLASLFLDRKNKIKRYVIGKNEESKQLSDIIKIDGIIDDFTSGDSYWNQIPILSSKNLSSNCIVVNCSSSISPITVFNYLLSIGVKKIIGLNEIIFASKSKISKPWFVSQMIEDYRNNYSSWIDLYESLSDELSKKTLLDVICYRVSADTKYMKDYTIRLSDQYFDEVINVINNNVFIDIGGFDGDTTEQFCIRHPNYKKVYLFEPSILNLNNAKIRLNKFERVEYIQMGLSDKSGHLFFDDSAGSASSVKFDSQNYNLIEVTTLDEYVDEPVDFIKMDIEGWELKALIGCKEHIKNDKPKLAIAVYHNASDFREIANYVLSIHPDYQIYIRHYTEGWSETIMYFIP